MFRFLGERDQIGLIAARYHLFRRLGKKSTNCLLSRQSGETVKHLPDVCRGGG